MEQICEAYKDKDWKQVRYLIADISDPTSINVTSWIDYLFDILHDELYENGDLCYEYDEPSDTYSDEIESGEELLVNGKRRIVTNYLGLIRLLLKKGARSESEINCLFRSQSFIYWASKNGHLGLVRLLLQYETITMGALEAAASSGHLGIVRLVLENTANTHKININEISIDPVLSNSHLEVARYLLEKGASFSSSSLYRAILRNDLGVVQFLIDNGDDVNSIVSIAEGWFTKTSIPIHIATKKGNLNIIRFLLDNEACVDRIDNEGNTPLYYAIEEGNLELVRLLLEYGAEKDVNHYFTEAVEKGASELVRIFIDNGINSNIYDEWRNTTHNPFFDCACSNNDVEMVQLLLDNFNNLYVDWPICEAIENGHIEIVQLLIKYGATVDIGLIYLCDETEHTEIIEFLKPCREMDSIGEWRPWNHQKYPSQYHNAIVNCLLLAKIEK